MILLSALYMFVAALLFILKAPRSTSRSNAAISSNPVEEPRTVTNARNLATDDGTVSVLVREIENIFERMEEGRQNT